VVHTPGRLTNTEKNELAERVAWMFKRPYQNGG
jgi:hypothetical protein